MLIDSHCHLNNLSQPNKKQVISTCSQGYIILDSSIDLETSKESIVLSQEYDFIYSSLGFHPFSCSKYQPKTIDEYQELISDNKKIIAIGEIGLDYKANIPLKEQASIFSRFIELAKSNGLPIIIHNRLDSLQVLDIIDEHFSDYQSVIFHCFSYSKSFLEKIIDKGGFISFSLNILRKNKDIFSSLASCPMDNLLLETDSPYMRINNRLSSPLDIKEVYDFVANNRGIEGKDLEAKVFSNAKKVFKL